MAKKPVIFKPTLHEPEGLNNYSGKVFRCFTRGDTLPFKFTFSAAEDGLDVSAWQVFIAISDQKATDANVGGDAALVETEIPLTDAATGVFQGEVTDTSTASLPDGIAYAMAKYVTDTGETHIIDMCILEIYPSVTYTVD